MADLIRIVRERRALILGIAASVVLLAILVVLAMPNVYSTTASVVLEPRKNNITDQTSVIAPLTIDAATLQNQIQILSSRELAAQVIRDLDLYSDPEFNSDLSGGILSSLRTALNPRSWFSAPRGLSADAQQGKRDEIITNFLEHLSIGSAGLSTTLTVTFDSRDPAKAARIASTIADTYVLNQVSDKMRAAQAATSWLTDRVSDLSQQVQQEEEKVQTYKNQNNLAETNTGIGIGGISPVADQQLATISTQLLTAKTVLAEKEAIYARVDTLVKSGNVGDVSVVVASPLISELRTQQADLVSKAADLSTRYGPLHPTIQAIETQKKELDSKIMQEALRVATSAGNDVVVARAHVATLQKALAAAEAAAGKQNVARARLRSLEANEASTRTTYEAFVARLRGVQNQDAIQSSEARVISRAPIPTRPVAPKRTAIVIASVPAGLLLGLLVALLLERFGPLLRVQTAQPNFASPALARATVRSAYSAAPASQTLYARPPVVAEIPHATEAGAADFMVDWPQSPFSQAVTALLARVHNKQTHCVAIATPEPSGHGSILATALARAAAQAGVRVLVIEADASAKAARAMRLIPPMGLADVLLNRVSLSSAVTRDTRSDALVLGHAHAPTNVSTMFVSPQMSRLTAYLRGNWDLVIIDAGAVVGGNAAVVSRQADATLLIGSMPMLRKPSLNKAVNLVRHNKSVGIVIAQ